jgi:hypothetical protein
MGFKTEKTPAKVLQKLKKNGALTSIGAFQRNRPRLSPANNPFAFLLIIGLIPGAVFLSLQGCSNQGSGSPVTDAAYDVKSSVGSASEHLLAQGTDQEKIKIEIQAVKGFLPNQKSQDLFGQFVKNLLHKQIEFVVDPEIPSPASADQTSYSQSDLSQIEADHRTLHSHKGEITVYYLFLDHPSSLDRSPHFFFAHAFENTSVAVYEPTVKDLSQKDFPPVPIEVMEGSVMAHEFGHILGLVGISKPPVHDHETQDHHCTHPCLMGADLLLTLRTLGVSSIPALDDDCLLDLGLSPKISGDPSGEALASPLPDATFGTNIGSTHPSASPRETQTSLLIE